MFYYKDEMLFCYCAQGHGVREPNITEYVCVCVRARVRVCACARACVCGGWFISLTWPEVD